jgi:hypothetical protein
LRQFQINLHTLIPGYGTTYDMIMENTENTEEIMKLEIIKQFDFFDNKRKTQTTIIHEEKSQRIFMYTGESIPKNLCIYEFYTL